MDTLLIYVGHTLLAAGLFFFWVSGLGLIRMPDLFTRMHAGTKATTLGSLLTLLGAACLQPDWAPKLLLLAVFILLTNPLSASVLARAGYRTGTEGMDLNVDACAERDRAQVASVGAKADPTEEPSA
ncbi:monovalent cation/H(+) antiporter subunit G [Allochromatium palmeri]|uniref:Na+/H+ antiporter subunit G n=1 Tax=Allochromatium palmeri TaxID=231048 RepID=A0A6N8E9M1_9GAMM|nr:monovalent cation/H(+) antiporter subunit G [Allochromatium palmeri]MTW20018.1 Na+/H+ antiporter subunit G [Allochromatium palmeri]